MVEPIVWIVLGFLIFISILDWKFKAIPSVFMTGMLLVVAIINYENLWIGVLAYIFAILLSDFEPEGSQRGLADTKSTVLVGLMLSTILDFMFFMVLIALFQFIYLFVVRKFIKDYEVPFIPVYLIVYIIMLIGGVL